MPNEEEEEEPESLRKKWEAEESRPLADISCRHCGQPIKENSFSCLYCGERVFDDSGPIGKLAKWIKDGRLILIILMILMGMLAFTLL
ncbi:MAG: hypothetical protein Q8R76_09355 [Candidatus Omnitrophota bacterium]|nr:hypothetical protein [Candidatus Omnitrophota bacterium]